MDKKSILKELHNCKIEILHKYDHKLEHLKFFSFKDINSEIFITKKALDNIFIKESYSYGFDIFTIYYDNYRGIKGSGSDRMDLIFKDNNFFININNSFEEENCNYGRIIQDYYEKHYEIYQNIDFRIRYYGRKHKHEHYEAYHEHISLDSFLSSDNKLAALEISKAHYNIKFPFNFLPKFFKVIIYIISILVFFWIIPKTSHPFSYIVAIILIFIFLDVINYSRGQFFIYEAMQEYILRIIKSTYPEVNESKEEEKIFLLSEYNETII